MGFFSRHLEGRSPLEGRTNASRMWVGAGLLTLLMLLVFWVISSLFFVDVRQPVPVIKAPQGPLRVALEMPLEAEEHFHIYAHMEGKGKEKDQPMPSSAHHRPPSAQKEAKPAVTYLSWKGATKKTLPTKQEISSLLADLK